jgi:hypothetical protein
MAYFPAASDPAEAEGRDDYFNFTILPQYPTAKEAYEGPKILLVDGYGRRNYDYTECMAAADNIVPLEDIYEATLRDAGYCYDKYDISGAGSNVHIHPVEYADYYDCVVWFTGPYFSNYLFDEEAQEALRDYLAVGGQAILCGDRLAYNMAPEALGGVGEDSLNGEFLSGILGCTYLEEQESPFTKDYIYMDGAPAITVGAGPAAPAVVPVTLDTTVIYRQCPYLKDMSYVRTNAAPPPGYTARCSWMS